MVVTYLARMPTQLVELGVHKTLESAFDEAAGSGALEVFLFDGNVAGLIHGIGVKKVYNLVKIMERYGVGEY